MTSQPRKQTIVIHILNNISQSEGNQNQILKFDQLIQYNMWSNFLEKLYTIRGWEASPNWVYVWINSLEFNNVCFYWLSKYIENIL